MDVLKRMFQKGEDKHGGGTRKSENNDEIDDEMATQWFENFDGMFDDGDDKFSLKIFTDPTDLQKHLEEQMQQVIEAVSEFEGKSPAFSKDRDFFGPIFDQEVWQEFDKQQSKPPNRDHDLDGDGIFSDQLHSLIQRFTTHSDVSNFQKRNNNDYQTVAEVPAKLLPRNSNRGQRRIRSMPKLSDQDIIMGCVHGTLEDDGSNAAGWYHESARRAASEAKSNFRADLLHPFGPMMSRSNSATALPNQDGVGGLPFTRSFSQSIVTKTVRKPDGTMETTRTVQDSRGNRTTSIIRSKDGKTETVTAYDDQQQQEAISKQANASLPALREYRTTQGRLSQSERNIYVSKEGYALPRNFY